MDPNQPIPPAVPAISTEPQTIVTTPPPLSPKTKYIVPLAIGGIVVMSIIGAIAAIVMSRRDTAMQVPTPPAFETLTPVQTYPVVFEQGNETNNSTQRTAVIKLPQGSRIPNAFHLEISFDPQLVTIDSIKAGKLWEQANDLNTKIENGKLTYDAGQGFGTKHTGSFELAVIQYTPRGNSPFQFTIGQGSRLGFVGENQLSPIAGATLTIDP
jgi:hypothetical protein